MQENNKAKCIFVKKKVTATAWNNYYNQVPGYCYLGKADRGVWIGFRIADMEKPKVPIDCELLTPADKLQMKEYYEKQHIEEI